MPELAVQTHLARGMNKKRIDLAACLVLAFFLRCRFICHVVAPRLPQITRIRETPLKDRRIAVMVWTALLFEHSQCVADDVRNWRSQRCESSCNEWQYPKVRFGYICSLPARKTSAKDEHKILLLSKKKRRRPKKCIHENNTPHLNPI